MKKTPTEGKTSQQTKKHQTQHVNHTPPAGRKRLAVTDSLTPGSASTSSASRLRAVHTAEAALNSPYQEGQLVKAGLSPRQDTNISFAYSSHGENESFEVHPLQTSLVMSSNEGVGLGVSSHGKADSSTADQEYDCPDGAVSNRDQQRTNAAIELLVTKMNRTMEKIRDEQSTKEDNVNEYLRLSTNTADKQQQQRVKNVFEKRNLKSTATLSQLQKKLEKYKQQLEEVKINGIAMERHRPAKEVFRDVSQGLKGFFVRDTTAVVTSREASPNRDVGANIREGITGFSGGVADHMRGAKETMVSKPKALPHHKAKFGSADNINAIGHADLLEHSHASSDKPHHTPVISTLPAGFKYRSDEEDASSVTSGSAPSAGHSNAKEHQSALNASLRSTDPGIHINFEPVLRELREQREAQNRLEEQIRNLQTRIQSDRSTFDETMALQKHRIEQLESQVMDLSEMRQHDLKNFDQDLTSMEERAEYKLDEGMRDLQDLLESCQTRITKMETQQNKQELISMEGFENSSFRALITKLINVVLAVLAVIFVLVSTAANLIGPFLSTRLRTLTTICCIALFVAVWHHWSYVEDLAHRIQHRLSKTE